MAHELVETLLPRLPRITAIIGGGGKTTLMLTLAHRLAAENQRVLITTTTHLAYPPTEHAAFLSPDSVEAANTAAKPGCVVLGGYAPASSGCHMVGLPPEWLARCEYDFILCEADGSRCLPLKVHKPGEPVIPSGTELVLQVSGLSALGKPICGTVHRWERLNRSPDTLVTPALVAAVQTLGWDSWAGAGITVLNQADTAVQEAAAQEVQRILKETGRESEYGSLCKEGAVCW